MLTMLAEAALRSFLLGSVVWIGLKLFRVQNPHAQMTSWIVVLLASLSMPLVMHLATLTISYTPAPTPVPQSIWPVETTSLEALPAPTGTPEVAPGKALAAIDWWALATAIYAGVAGLMMLRLAVGLCLTWHLVRTARPLSEPWFADADVRVSLSVEGPVTFGSTILVPAEFEDWEFRKRKAVLAHEGAHVRNGDFYVLLLASLNRSLFWFSPFAWWQLIRLAEIAEVISDGEAIEILDDRLGYAEILLQLVRNIERARPAGIEMARASTVPARIAWIVAAVTVPPRVAWRKRIGIVAALLPAIVVSSGTIAYRPEPAAASAVATAEQSAATVQWLQDVDFYAFNPRSVLAIFHQGDSLSAQLTGQHRLRLAATENQTYSYPAATGLITFTIDGEPPAELTLHQNGHDLRVPRIATRHRTDADATAMVADPYVGWYELTPGRVLAVTRDGDRLHVQETGRAKFEVKADGPDAFSSGRDDLLVFARDGQGRVTQVLVCDPASGARLAPRIDAAKAKGIEDEFARRIAETSGHFRDQTPAPGSKEAVLRGIANMQRGAPNYDRLSAPLVAKIRRDFPRLQAMFASLGEVESIFFRGVGPGGYDIYGVKFATGSAEFRLLMGEEGKVDDVIFRPDGNEAPGGVVACADEPRLKSAAKNVPIKIMFYNNTGDDIRLYNLEADGTRNQRGAVGDSMSSSHFTSVDTPWIVTDRAGRCLEIVLPGQRTRYLTVEASPGGNADRPVTPRTAPLPGSEETLRLYIEALRRGEPDYDRMTSEVAAQTRQQLPFDQAILGKLGRLRALSFRGVTVLGGDIYIGHFANGSAEWRINLGKDGTIARIALGPQY